MELALSVREYLGNREELESFIYNKKADVLARNKGAFNLFVAGIGWSYIPDLPIL